jgi:hypothetical protein
MFLSYLCRVILGFAVRHLHVLNILYGKIPYVKFCSFVSSDSLQQRVTSVRRGRETETPLFPLLRCEVNDLSTGTGHNLALPLLQDGAKTNSLSNHVLYLVLAGNTISFRSQKVLNRPSPPGSSI